MKLIYRGGAYKILCTGKAHIWRRTRAVLPLNPTRTFAAKGCDCERLKALGIKFPITSELKQEIGYYAPGTLVIGRYVEGKP